MALEFKPGTKLRVTISKQINREAALRTIERIFMQDKTLAQPLEQRSRNFVPIPKRRGGRIWTKRPNKIHLSLTKGLAATVKSTPQTVKDLNSVADFVEVAAQ